MMKYYRPFLLLLALLASNSCGKDFGDLNVDPNNPQTVPSEVLLTSAEKTLADNLSIYAPFGDILAQSWAANNYTDASRYLIDAGYLNAWFSSLYAGALEDLADLQKVVVKHPGLNAAEDKNRIAIAKVLQTYTFQVLTDCFGPVPYSVALKGADNPAPKYDSQRDIYIGLLRDLHEAIGQMDESAGSFGAADVIYNGDVAKWKRFAHWLLLRVALRISDVEPDLARAEVEAAATGAIGNIGDNACFQFLAGTPNNCPFNKQRNERGDADWGLSNILIDKTLNPLNDPRRAVFADERVKGGGYFGRPYGQENGEAASQPPDLYSQPSGATIVREGRSDFKQNDVLRPDAKACLMSYAEVCFILAEASQRGWNVPDPAPVWYDRGITASMNEWGIHDQTIIDAYLAQDEVKYDPSPDGWKQKLGVQKWLALYMQGLQGWIEWRRLDFQKLEPPVAGSLGGPDIQIAPLRLFYPSNEQGLNSEHYQEAVQTLLGGPDKLSTRVWWDVQ